MRHPGSRSAPRCRRRHIISNRHAADPVTKNEIWDSTVPRESPFTLMYNSPPSHRTRYTRTPVSYLSVWFYFQIERLVRRFRPFREIPFGFCPAFCTYGKGRYTYLPDPASYLFETSGSDYGRAR